MLVVAIGKVNCHLTPATLRNLQ